MPGHVNIAKIDQLIIAKFGSHSAFVKKSGISKQYVSKLLNGKMEPSIDKLVEIANQLEVCVDDLLIR